MKKQVFLFSVISLISLEALGSALRRRPVSAVEGEAQYQQQQERAGAVAGAGSMSRSSTSAAERTGAAVSSVATKAQADAAAAANPAAAAAAAIKVAEPIAGKEQPDATVLSYLTGKPVLATNSNNKHSKLGRLK